MLLHLLVLAPFVAAILMVMTSKEDSKSSSRLAILMGIGFTAVQYLYLETQVMVAKQSAIYGFLAALPLFMIWLNLGWTIVLYGAELSYSFQNVNHLNPSELL